MDPLNDPRRSVDKKADGMPRGWGVLLALAVALIVIAATTGIFR